MTLMNKKKMTLLALAIIAFIFTYLLFTVKTPKKSFYHHNISLENLRQKIAFELQHADINTSQPLILDNICRLENKTGSCYFNSTIQALLANRSFTLFMIMTKFNTNQEVCIIMQKVVQKTLTNSSASLLEYIDELGKIESFENAFKRVGGNVSYCLLKLLKKMNEECFNIDWPGSPYNFLVNETIKFTCDRCKQKNNLKKQYVVLDIYFGDNLAQCFSYALKILRYEVKNMMIKCSGCSKYDIQKDLQFAFYVPHNIIIDNGRITKKHKDPLLMTGVMDATEKMMIGTSLYVLYAITCIHKGLEDYHVITVAKKGAKWYWFDDTNIREVCLDSDEVKNNAMMYLYRKVR